MPQHSKHVPQQVRRFVKLLDLLYDRRVRLIVAASGPMRFRVRVLIPTFVWFCVECPVTQHVSVITKLVLGSVGEGLGRIQVPGSTVGFGTTRLASSCSPSLLPSLSLSLKSLSRSYTFSFSLVLLSLCQRHGVVTPNPSPGRTYISRFETLLELSEEGGIMLWSSGGWLGDHALLNCIQSAV